MEVHLGKGQLVQVRSSGKIGKIFQRFLESYVLVEFIEQENGYPDETNYIIYHWDALEAIEPLNDPPPD